MEIVPKFYGSFLSKAIYPGIDTGIDKLKYFHVLEEPLFDFVAVLFIFLNIISKYFCHGSIDYILAIQIHEIFRLANLLPVFLNNHFFLRTHLVGPFIC